jgi:hypothetical protein
MHPMVFAHAPDGTITTIQDLGVSVATLAAAEPVVRGYVQRARRLGAVRLQIDVWDDRECRSVFRGWVRDAGVRPP